MGLLITLLILAAAVALVVTDGADLSGFGLGGLSGGQLAALLIMGTFFLVIVGSLFGSYRGRAFAAMRDVFVWVAIALGLVAGYSYREELAQLTARVRGELAPPGTAVSLDGQRPGEIAVRIRRAGDGHFKANALVNGQSMSLLVDTGASTVVLRHADAERLGIDTRRLAYNVPVQTANGVTQAAAIRLQYIAIGSIRIDGIEALVARPGALRENLLGMTFLSRLRSYEFSGEFLTLRS